MNATAVTEITGDADLIITALGTGITHSSTVAINATTPSGYSAALMISALSTIKSKNVGAITAFITGSVTDLKTLSLTGTNNITLIVSSTGTEDAADLNAINAKTTNPVTATDVTGLTGTAAAISRLMSETMMDAVETAGFGGPDVLRLAHRPMPTVGQDEVLIRVAASGINRPDVLQRLGRYAAVAKFYRPGRWTDAQILEEHGFAAELAAAGFKLGDRVCALVAGGGYAQYCVAPVGQCLPVPAGLSDIEAASLPETAFTVWSNVFDRAALKRGETILIHGGSSGIGVTAVQFA